MNLIILPSSQGIEHQLYCIIPESMSKDKAVALAKKAIDEFDSDYQAWAMSDDESGKIPKLNDYLLKHGLVVTTPVIGPSWE